MKNLFIYVAVSAIVASVITNCTDMVFAFGAAWFNFFASLGVLAYKLDK